MPPALVAQRAQLVELGPQPRPDEAAVARQQWCRLREAAQQPLGQSIQRHQPARDPAQRRLVGDQVAQ